MCKPACLPLRLQHDRRRHDAFFLFLGLARPAQAGRSHGAFHEAVEPVHNTPGFYKMSVTAHFMNPMNLFTTRVGGGEIVALPAPVFPLQIT